MSTQSFKVKSGMTLTPVNPSTLTSPQSGDIVCDSTDLNKIKRYNATSLLWETIGTGAPNLDSVFQLFCEENLTDWLTGDNATFMGGGTISGTFEKNFLTPIAGTDSYKYTQALGSLNDYFVSPAQPVALKFRGQTVTLLFPFKYNGSTNDIEVVLYDATNAAVIPSSNYITSSTTISMFKTNFVIPSTCQSIRVGFHVKVLNSGKILEFDDIVMSSNTTLYSEINELQTVEVFNGYCTTSAGAATSIVTYESSLSTLLLTPYISGGNIILQAKVPVNISVYAQRTDTNGADYIQFYKNGTVYLSALSNINGNQSNIGGGSIEMKLAAGEYVQIDYIGPGANTGYFGCTARSIPTKSANIVTVSDTFSTDTAPLTYAGSGTYTLSTLAAAPVGTYITYKYAAGTNTRTQTTGSGAGDLRPTQTDANMNSNGILMYTRNYAAASTGELPSCIAIQIGKSLKGKNIDIYKTAAKVTSGDIDLLVYSVNANQRGFFTKSYNETTGILFIDAGYCADTTVTSNLFTFSDQTTQSSGYVVVNAAKNPALTGLDNTIIPAGTISAYAAATAPTGYLTCDGSAVSRTTYSRLFATIGITHGQGDGSTTFNIPNYQGRFLRMVDGSAGLDPDKLTRTAMATGGNTGNNVGSVQADAYQNHSHIVPTGQETNSGGNDHISSSSPGGLSYTNLTTSASTTGSTETRPENAYVNYIIKY